METERDQHVVRRLRASFQATGPDQATERRILRKATVPGAGAHPTALKEQPAPASGRWSTGFLGGHRGLAAAAAVAVMVTATAVMLAVGIPGAGNNGLEIGVPPAQAQPLLTLASRVLAASAPKGDATLVLHTDRSSTDSVGTTGADLYLDDGRYFYAPNAAGLPTATEAEYDLQPAIEAAASVAHTDPEAARVAFLKAIGPLFPGDTLGDAPGSVQDNRIWITAIDALGAAYGRPEVLAGMLNVLSTIDGVAASTGTYKGESVLEVSLAIPAHTAVVVPTPEAIANASASDRPRLEELAKNAKTATTQVIGPSVQTLTLNNQTGALLVYQDKVAGGVTVTYQISRVNAADHGVH